MKILKVTLLLVIFCLSFSGTSPDAVNNNDNDSFKANKVEFKDIVLHKTKSSPPPQA